MEEDLKPQTVFTMFKLSDALPVQFYLDGQPSFNEKIEQGIEHHCFFQPFNEDDPIKTKDTRMMPQVSF